MADQIPPGSVWRSRDPRESDRLVRVVDVTDGRVTIALVGARGRPARGHEHQQKAEPGRLTTVAVSRFPKAFSREVSDA